MTVLLALFVLPLTGVARRPPVGPRRAPVARRSVVAARSVVFPPGNAYHNQWTYPDRKLHKQRWRKGLYDRGCHRRAGICGKQSASEANQSRYQASPVSPAPQTPSMDAGDGFMNIPDGIDEELPFN
mgnify:CR=1 FL=1